MKRALLFAAAAFCLHAAPAGAQEAPPNPFAIASVAEAKSDSFKEWTKKKAAYERLGYARAAYERAAWWNVGGLAAAYVELQSSRRAAFRAHEASALADARYLFATISSTRAAYERIEDATERAAAFDRVEAAYSDALHFEAGEFNWLRNNGVRAVDFSYAGTNVARRANTALAPPEYVERIHDALGASGAGTLRD